ncbi:MAG: PPK2 family polyphosphate kinase [Bacteroidota bacterium]
MGQQLKNLDSRAPQALEKVDIKSRTAELLGKMREQQKVLYAQKKYSLLVILQGLDASGKDGVVNNVFSHLNLLGCDVSAFKAPNPEELSHDFLWRIHPHAPAKGMIRIFNRSHYEDVLVPRVEKWIDKKTLKRRFDHINHFEQLLADSGTVILKFYLHISKERQLERLNERLENPEKYWKHNDSDFTTREKWDAYMEAYEDVFEKCGSDIPWHLIPSDQKWYKEYLIAKVITDELGKLPLEYPGKEVEE